MKKYFIIFAVTIFVGASYYFEATRGDDDYGLSEKNLSCQDCNLIVISLTNTRKDHVGIYGYDRDTTPNIDKFFENSLVFNNTFASASWSLPVSASLFTSLHPYTHSVMDRYADSRLDDNILTFAEILKNRGYKTAGLTGGGDYNRKFNIAQGFDFYLDEENYSQFDVGVKSEFGRASGSYLGIEQLAPFAVDWLKNNRKNKFFLFLQGYDAHCPFTPNEEFRKRFDENSGDAGNVDFSFCLGTSKRTEPIIENGVKYWNLKTYTDEEIKEVKLKDGDIKRMISLYDGEIAQADYYLKNIFDAVGYSGLKKNTIIIFMSEHGDLMGEHGRFMRGGSLSGTFYEPVLNFPLLIRHPKIDKPARVDSLIQTVDIMPTLLEILGIEDPDKKKRQGQNIVPAITGEREVNEHAYAASRFKSKESSSRDGMSSIEAVRNKKWKLIKEESFDPDTNAKILESYELYNISEDPEEKLNLYDVESIIANNLRKRLDQHGKR